MPTITRRDLIVGTTGAVTIAVGFSHVAQPRETITLDEFRALSAKLTGVDAASLDPTAATKLLDGFLSLGHGPDLAALASEHGTDTGPLANEIVAAWYSGRYASRAGPATINLNQALLWTVLDFTKPPGDCGGETGYWAKPNQN
jgi:Membrane bound FAD containing D-sorbitol dehydrogenase